MSTTVSKVEKGAQGSVDWRIENWAADFELLKTFAKCTLMIPNDNQKLGILKTVQLRFFFHDRGTYLALWGELVSGGQLPMAISVDLETSTTNPASFANNICTVHSCGQPFTVQETFMHKIGQRNQFNHITVLEKELHLKITATIMSINKNEMLTESEEGAVGGACSVAEASMLKDIKFMFNADENYSDLKIETKDNMTLSGHRFILAARSPGFRKLIDDQVKNEGFSGVIKVSEVNAKPLVVVLHWMYTGELHENAGKVMEDVMKICVAFEIPALLKILDKKLIAICNIQNMFQLFQAAQQHGLHTAKEDISAFIKE